MSRYEYKCVYLQLLSNRKEHDARRTLGFKI